MVNRTVILSRKRETGEGCCINWKVHCAFVVLQMGMKPRGRVGSKSLEMWERGVWAWAPWDPGSSVSGTKGTGSCSILPRSTGQSDWRGQRSHLAQPALRVPWDWIHFQSGLGVGEQKQNYTVVLSSNRLVLSSEHVAVHVSLAFRASVPWAWFERQL